MFLSAGLAEKNRPRRLPRIGQTQVPASVRGLNQHDGISAMKPDDALILDNWFPEATYLRVRGGTSTYATGLGTTVYSLMEWAGPTSRKFFGATAHNILDITEGGSVDSIAVGSLTSGYWQTTMMTTPGGSYLMLANGADTVRSFDGTNWAEPAITGVTSSTLNFVCLHKSRLWFVQNNSTKAWYLPTSSIAGAAVSFELGERFTLGGKLIAIGTVSRDGGAGSDDYLAFISSSGQIAVFQGDDPASANTWALVGVYSASPPIGNRCCANVGGDLAVLTESAIVSVRQLMAGGQASAERQSISNRIDQGIIAAFASYGALAGWSVSVYPRYRQAIFNVPTSATTSFQYVVNTQTGAWCTYSNIYANCWGIFNEEPYFGNATGIVLRAESGYTDSTPSPLIFLNDNGDVLQSINDDTENIYFIVDPVSTPITAELKTSFQSYGSAGALDRLTMIRALFTAGGQVVPAIRINVDYRDEQPMTADEYPLSAGSSGAVWDLSLWDDATWGSTDSPYSNWQSATGIGTCASIHMMTQTAGISVKLNAFDLKFESSQAVAL